MSRTNTEGRLLGGLIVCSVLAVFMIPAAFFWSKYDHQHAWHWVYPKGADSKSDMDRAHRRASGVTQGNRYSGNFEYYLGVELRRLGWRKENDCCKGGE